VKLHLIQDMVTGQRLPHGGTYAEFTNDLPPRLFPSYAAAHSALRKWLEGHWGQSREWESTGDYGEGFYYQGLPAPLGGLRNVELRATRQAMSIQIRPVRLEVQS